MKELTLWSVGVTVISALMIIFIQQKVIGFSDYQAQHNLEQISIPVLLLFMCCAIQVGFTATIMAAF